MGEALTIAQSFYDNFGAGRFAAGLFADDCITVMPTGAVDQAGHQEMFTVFRNGFPDARMEVAHAVETDTEVFISGHFKGTNTGDLVGPAGTVPASGNALDLAYADYFRVVDGKIVAHEVFFDQMSLLGQIGALPAS